MASTTSNVGISRVKVHWLEESRAQRIIWLLEELRLPYDVETYRRNPKTLLAPPELRKVHPLGKSPIVTLSPAEGSGDKPITLAESGLIVQYLTERVAPRTNPSLLPPRWLPGRPEGDLFSETEAWRRYQYILHFTEGSLMPPLFMSLVLTRARDNVPFFVKPIMQAVISKLNSIVYFPTVHAQWEMLDSFLAKLPDAETAAAAAAEAETAGEARPPDVPAGESLYICGDRLTAADIMLSFPLFRARERIADMGDWKGGSPEAEFPRVFRYIARLEANETYQKSIQKMNDTEAGIASRAVL